MLFTVHRDFDIDILRSSLINLLVLVSNKDKVRVPVLVLSIHALVRFSMQIFSGTRTNRSIRYRYPVLYQYVSYPCTYTYSLQYNLQVQAVVQAPHTTPMTLYSMNHDYVE